MTRRRGRNGRSEDLLPEDLVLWAQEMWRDRKDVAKLPVGVWMLRQVAKTRGLPEEVVDEVSRESRSSRFID